MGIFFMNSILDQWGWGYSDSNTREKKIAREGKEVYITRRNFEFIRKKGQHLTKKGKLKLDGSLSITRMNTNE